MDIITVMCSDASDLPWSGDKQTRQACKQSSPIPIKHMWDEEDLRLSGNYPPVTTLQHLIDMLQAKWQAIL